MNWYRLRGVGHDIPKIQRCNKMVKNQVLILGGINDAAGSGMD